MGTVEDIKNKMKDTLEHFKKDLSTLRTGRANPNILDSVPIEVYGSHHKIRELANITTPEPRQLLLNLFDPQTSAAIAKSIEKANLGLHPIVEGNIIRINIPPMDENMRKEIVKQGKKKAEDAKIAIREIRRKGNDLIRKQKNEGGIAEDEMKKAEKKIQDLTDDFCKQIDDLFSNKEKEILKI